MDQVSRHFGQVQAVDEVSLQAPKGIILGLIGPSGSGKTTLIRLLTGTLAPTTGTLSVLGEEPTRFSGRTRERMGYMAQHFVHYPDLTVAENVSFVGSLFGLLWPRRRKRVREVLEVVELYEVRGRLARHLSGGMQRRLSLACALVNQPDLLFLDEPSAGVDPLLRQRIWGELRRCRDRGDTLVITTQYVAEAEYCDLVAVIDQGRLMALAPPEQLRREALGGDAVLVTTAQPMDGSQLKRIAGVTQVRQQEPKRFLVIAEPGSVTTSHLVRVVLEENGAEVLSASEYRPPFDEVFAELLRHTGDQANASESKHAA